MQRQSSAIFSEHDSKSRKPNETERLSMRICANNMKRIPILATAALIVTSGLAALKESPDPVIGRWRWTAGQTTDQIVECKSNNTFSVTPTKRTGTWKLLQQSNAERKYVFTWDGGLYVDTLIMSRNQKELSGENQKGLKIRGQKIE
jgi:hypothetical protein